ncbi:Abi family protein [Pedobacter insulae]|uniref:Abortive infection bacteriophage resistance protein n=1 Tax=Pedobacter insulae TaxID=414048 RepID=A0A1I3A8D8_9SPHI|nr:Abi family protein [Pedobacter insulae]SFH46298.1 Abortive infection bacteriophage resistance protein [Pedobacter insulae]
MYNKAPLTINQQIAQLRARGLEITADDNAPHFLSHISYYRLAGYWWPMQAEPKENHIFKPDSKFADVISLYNFDREFRIVVFDAIEKIEISLRTKLIYHLSHEFGPWWFQNLEIYQNGMEAAKTLATLGEEIERSKDAFIKEHKRKYKDDLRFPPSWKSLELTSLGALSRIYGNLKNTITSKDTIAAEFGVVNHTFLPSWLQSIAQIRNYCAHHSRLWNRNLPSTLKLLPKPPNPWIADVPTQTDFPKIYVHLCCIKYLLNVIQPQNNLTIQLAELFAKYPSVDQNAMGMKPNWQQEPLWIF